MPVDVGDYCRLFVAIQTTHKKHFNLCRNFLFPVSERMPLCLRILPLLFRYRLKIIMVSIFLSLTSTSFVLIFMLILYIASCEKKQGLPWCRSGWWRSFQISEIELLKKSCFQKYQSLGIMFRGVAQGFY